MAVLVTGGAGYIGSHTCVELIASGYDVVVIDNLVNSKREALLRIEQITGRDVRFYEADVRSEEALKKIFKENKVDAVIHFAGLKAVGESVIKPLEYYENNISSTTTLCRVMNMFNCKNIIFSSSATVYGSEAPIPYSEKTPKGACTNPYGWTKWMVEQILTDLYNSDKEWNVTLLRYFNPIGAHKSGLIGEDPCGIPNNLLPYIAQVAVGKRDCLGIFGNDYDTPDGTGVRDYIHVVDLARGHVAALKKLKGLNIYNLGTGVGCSVMEVIAAFEKACNKTIPYKIMPRRAGDLAAYYADPTKAQRELGWEAKLNLSDMCEDTWRWQSKNPNGYGE